MTWQAPSTPGTVIIQLEADDAPDAVFDECPTSSNGDRDDDPNNFETTVSVSLPGGCEECDLHEGISIFITPQHTATPAGCGPCLCGSTDFSGMNYNAELPCYIGDCVNSPIWKFRVTAEVIGYYGACNDFTNISGPDDVNADNYCEIVEGFRYDPETPLDPITHEAGCVNASGDPPKYSNSDCIEEHEEKHVDMAVEALNDRITELFASGIFELPIDCDWTATTDCSSAYVVMNQTIYLAINDAFTHATEAALDEGPPRAAASQCFRDIADAICADPRWDCNLCN
jgi:hypothetical protein